MTPLTISLAQMNPVVGDIDGNTAKIIALSRQAHESDNADIIVFPELTLTGYPPEDLLLRPSLQTRIEAALAQLIAELPAEVTVVCGYPKHEGLGLFNVVGAISDGAIQLEYAKQCLPNYQVFDEKRYFLPGNGLKTFSCRGHRVALSICEDIWQEQTALQARDSGADVLLNLNASPFHRDKQQAREQMLQRRAQEAGMPIVYVNQVGGQDELVFDGGSVVVNGDGQLCMRAKLFDTDLVTACLDTASLNTGATKPAFICQDVLPLPDDLALIYDALVLGVRDYVNKNGFKRAVIGLSGGIDSALTLAIAADALGTDRVEAIMMPFRYTSQLSQDDAADQAKRMGVKYHVMGIENVYEACLSALAPIFEGTNVDKTEENIQARSRGLLLMAVSNKTGSIVLTTGNKSEMSVGYATLYGDMVGGFAVLKDVPKVTVFALANYRNTRYKNNPNQKAQNQSIISPVIPESVITRPPSAELAPNQVDEDSLPPYEILDQILEMYIERDMSATAIIAEGFEANTVRTIIRLVDVNEYKRRQAAIGVRISERGFGRDRRYPITNGWRIGD